VRIGESSAPEGFMAFCSSCGTQIPEGQTMCPACSRPAATVTPQTTTGGGLTDNVAGMLAYVTIIPAIIFLVIEPYNRNRFIRFHSFQCIFFCIALFALGIALSVLTVVPFMALITIPLHLLIGVGGFVVWIILLIKANQGQMYKLPVIGEMAAKQAGA
jgi:uncharacterized membrane protein